MLFCACVCVRVRVLFVVGGGGVVVVKSYHKHDGFKKLLVSYCC